MNNSGIGWIDFSDEHRQRVMSVIDLVKGEGMVDELGIGSIRDGIANRLFPGVSTIQTRARYFTILPSIFLHYIKKHEAGEKVPPLSEYLRTTEKEVIDYLTKNSSDETGIIGVTIANSKKDLAQYPSSIYWNGLRTHKIIDTELSLAAYLATNDLSKVKKTRYKNDETTDDLEAEMYDSFHIRLGEPIDLGEELTIQMSKSEASFLQDFFISIVNSKKEDNLLSVLLKQDSTLEEFIRDGTFSEMANRLTMLTDLPQATKEVLEIALTFDHLIHGAHIIYNLRLAQISGIADFKYSSTHKHFKERTPQELWENWVDSLTEWGGIFDQFDLQEICQELAPNTDQKTIDFINTFRVMILQDTSHTQPLIDLVKGQEIRKKGNRSRLRATSGDYTDWIGISALNYRYFQARTIIKDIIDARS